MSESIPVDAPPAKHKRRRWPWIVLASVIVVVGAGAFYVYRTYVPATPTVTAGSGTGLSNSDKQLMAQAATLGQQAADYGSKLGQSALFGDQKKADQVAHQLKTVGQQLSGLGQQAEDPRLAAGLAQAGKGAVLTANGVLELSPSMTDQGLKLIKQSQDVLNSIQ